ncbi:MAG: hypothetical protein R6X02_05545 [Enhygromyxa sp.]
MADEEATYTCGSIIALSLVEAIRRRPGMYVGDVSDGSGQHELIEGLVERAMLDHLAGHRTRAGLKLEGARGWFATTGRPLVPVEWLGGFEVYFTGMSGCNDLTLPILNGLCRHLQVDVRYGGGLYRQHFARGSKLGPAARIADAVGTGLRLEFELDDTIFEPRSWDLERLHQHAQELCGLAPGLELAVQGRALTAPEGILSLLAAKLEAPVVTPIIPPIVCSGLYDKIDVEVALTWVQVGLDATQPRIHGFANRRRTRGGTHHLGVLKGIGEAFANLDPAMGDVDPLALAELLQPGLVAIVHVELQEPDWDQCRAELRGTEVSDAVAYIVQRQLTKAWRVRPEAFNEVRVACLGRLAGR